MKFFFLPLLLCFSASNSFGQSENNWIMFIDKSTNLIGYKNQQGEIKIKPKFTYLTQQNIFRNIMPVYEKSTTGVDSMLQYYLLKNGEKVGTDSLYLGDYFLDCENENKIRFRDPLTDKVGFFNNKGEVIIPALYNDATPFHNGLSLAIKDGKRMCPDGIEYSDKNPCEHWNWEGNHVLINDKNEVLLDSLLPGKFENLDLYSMIINPEKTTDDYTDFTATNGNIYSFKDLRKEFISWLKNSFLPSRNLASFHDYFFPEVTIPRESQFKSQKFLDPKYSDYAWTVDDPTNVLETNHQLVTQILEKIYDNQYLTSIARGNAPILLDENRYGKYFSDCGDYLGLKYPYFEVIITNNNGLVLNGLGFIRTTDGYKLIEIY